MRRGHRDGVTQSPQLNVHVSARVLLDQISTRIYFEGSEANVGPVLTVVAAARRTTVLAGKDGEVDGARRSRFDIVLEGQGETVFLDLLRSATSGRARPPP